MILMQCKYYWMLIPRRTLSNQSDEYDMSRPVSPKRFPYPPQPPPLPLPEPADAGVTIPGTPPDQPWKLIRRSDSGRNEAFRRNQLINQELTERIRERNNRLRNTAAAVATNDAGVGSGVVCEHCNRRCNHHN